MSKPLLISIDLETRAQDPSIAAIASIGMVASSWNREGWLDTYYAEIKAESALAFGQEDEKTMAWWQNQPEHARAVLIRGSVLVPDALRQLRTKIDAINPVGDSGRRSGRVVVIARAPQFDLTILRRHFAACEIPCPWEYWQERDHRTFEQAWRGIAKTPSGQPWPKYTDWSPVAHNALVDAQAQASYLIKLSERVRGQQS